MNIAAAEREKYEDAWSLPGYSVHSPGVMYLPLFKEFAEGVLADTFPVREHYRTENLTPSMFTILDAGCGAGKGTLALQQAGFQNVALCDLTQEGLQPGILDYYPFVQIELWADLRRVAYLAKAFYDGAANPAWQHRFDGEKFDFVYCTDVLEHLPEAFTMLAVARMLEVARYGVFISVSLVPDTFGAWVGTALHQTVKPFVWWRDQFRVLGSAVEGRDLLNAAVFMVRP